MPPLIDASSAASDANLQVSDITTNDVSSAAHGFAPKLWAAVWTAWTPTIVAGGGSFTTASAAGRYIQIGKTVIYKADITITTVGTGTGCTFTLPVNAQTSTGVLGTAREDATTGNMGVVKFNASVSVASIARYDNGNIASGGSGSVIRVYGSYEAA